MRGDKEKKGKRVDRGAGGGRPRKRTEAAPPPESPERMVQLFSRPALDSFGLPIFFVAPSGRIFYANDSACSFLGYTREELLSLSIPDINSDITSETWPDTWREIRDRGVMTFESHHLTKAGEVVPVEITVTSLKSEGEEFNCALVRDISERRRAEEVTRQRERRIVRAQELALLSAWEWDMAADRITWSENLYALYDIAPETDPLTYGALMERVHPEDRDYHDRLVADWTEARRGGSFEYRVLRPDGSVRYVLGEGEVQLDDEGRPVRMFGILQDITERKEAEDMLRRANDMLDSIRDAQSTFISEGDPATVFQKLLQAFISLTDSEHGFVDEVLTDAEGRLYKRTLALSDISWDEGSRKLYQELVASDMEFRNLKTLAALPVTTGEVVISNEPAEDPRRGGLPEGHPPLTSYMGIPLYFGAKLVGVAGVANRPGGYDRRLASFLEPFTSTCANIIHALKSEQERREAEEALRESEATLKSIFRATPTGIGLSVEGLIKQANEQLCEMLGYSREELLGRQTATLYPTEEDYEAVGRDKYAQIRRRGTGSLETRWRRKDGEVIHVLLNSTALDPDDLSAGVIFSALDITQRKKAEEGLRETMRYLASLVDSSPLAIIATDQAGQVTFFNPGAEALLGHRKEEIIGQHVTRLYPSEEQAKEVKSQMRLGGGAVSGFETTLVDKEGGLVPVLISASLLYDDEGREAGTVGFNKDLREIKLREEENRLTHEITLAIGETEGLTSALVVTLRRMCEAMGWPLGEAWIPANDGEALVCEARWSSHPEEMEKFLSSSEDYTFQRAQGLPGRAWSSKRMVLMEDVRVDADFIRSSLAREAGLQAGLAFPVLAGDEVVAVLVFFSFASKSQSERAVELASKVAAQLGFVILRKRADEDLRAAHAELQKAYETLEKAQASAIATEKLAALGRLTAGVSHEILNPLNVLTLSLHMLINDRTTPPHIADELREMQLQANRITKIAQDLLSFSRQRPLERRALNLNKEVRRALDLLERELKYANIAVDMRLAEGLPPVLGDLDQIQQVTVNLLTNARDAMPNGGCLAIRTRRTSPVFAGEAEAVELRVEDTGRGIEPEAMDKLFEPFFTTKPVGEGTGLGLSICKGIVEAHGGEILAENVPSGGAAFVIRLPVEPDETEGPTPGG